MSTATTDKAVSLLNPFRYQLLKWTVAHVLFFAHRLIAVGASGIEHGIVFAVFADYGVTTKWAHEDVSFDLLQADAAFI